MPDTQPTATPLSRSIELHLTGQPDTKNKYGSGHIRPERVVFYYLTDRTNAHLFGSWIRPGGEQTDAPVDQLYRHDDNWPDWLAGMARKHQPKAAPSAVEALMAALEIFDQIAEREGPAMAHAWMIGMNPHLDDQAPILAITNGRTAEVQAAARAYLDGVWT